MATIGTMPLTFPTVKLPSFAKMIPRSIIGMSISPFSGKDQVQVHPGFWWEMTLPFPPMVRADAAAFISFRLRLNGPEGNFLLGDPNAATPRGTADGSPGTPVIDGANQVGNVLNITGAPAGAVNYLLEHDYINIGSGATTRMYMVILDAPTADSIGAIALSIWPPLRDSPANGSTVIVSSAKGIFRLIPQNLDWDVDTAELFGITVKIREFVF